MVREKVLLHHSTTLPDLNRNQTTPGESSVRFDVIVVNFGDETAHVRCEHHDVLADHRASSALDDVWLSRGLQKMQNVTKSLVSCTKLKIGNMTSLLRGCARGCLH